eukprot:403335739
MKTAGLAKRSIENTNTQVPGDQQIFSDDYFLEVIKSKGFGYGKKDSRQYEILNLRNLCFSLENLLFQYVDSGSDSIFPLYIVNYLLQTHGDLQTVEKELMKLWYSVLNLNDQEMIVKIYQSFLSNQFKSANIHFFVKTSRVILQNIIGDRFHDVSMAELQQDLSQVYIPTDKIVDIVGKLFTSSSFLNLEGELPQINQSQITGNLFNNLKIMIQNGQSMVNCQNLQIQCLTEYRTIEHKSYVQQMQNYTKSLMQSRRQTLQGAYNLGLNQKILQQQPTFYSFEKIYGSSQENESQLNVQQKKVQNVLDSNIKSKILGGFSQTGTTTNFNKTQQVLHQQSDFGEHSNLIDSILQGQKKPKRQLVSTPLLKDQQGTSTHNQTAYQKSQKLGGVQDKSLMNIQELPAQTARNGTTNFSQVMMESSLRGSPGPNNNTNLNQSLGIFNETMNFNTTAKNYTSIQQQQQQQQYQAYQIKKMYNHEEVRLLEAPETKLRELQLKLKESDKDRQDLKRDQIKLVQEIVELRNQKSNENQDRKFIRELESLIKAAFTEVQVTIEENIKLKEQANQPTSQTLDRKRKLKNTFDQIFVILNSKNYQSQESSYQSQPKTASFNAHQESPQQIRSVNNTQNEYQSSRQQQQTSVNVQNSLKMLKKNNQLNSDRSIEQSQMSLQINNHGLSMQHTQTQNHFTLNIQQQIQPDSFSQLLMGFKTKPQLKVEEFFKGKIEGALLKNAQNQQIAQKNEKQTNQNQAQKEKSNILGKVSQLHQIQQQQQNNQAPPELPPRSDFDEDEDSSDNDDDLQRDSNFQDFNKKSHSSFKQQENYNEQLEQNEYQNQDLISDLGSDIENVLETSIRGNIRNLLEQSINSSVMSNQDFHLERTSSQLNKLAVPNPLPQQIKVDENFLAQFSNPQVFYLFTAVEDFNAIEKRHLNMVKGQVFVGLKEFGTDWIFGCKENDPRAFGFVPKNYLDFQKEMRRV